VALELAFKSGQRGGQRTQLYLTNLALRLSARPDPARRAGATTRLGTGDPEPAKQATTPRAALSSRDPRARVVPRSGPTSSPGNSHIPRLGPVTSRRTWLSVWCRSCTTPWKQEPGGQTFRN